MIFLSFLLIEIVILGLINIFNDILFSNAIQIFIVIINISAYSIYIVKKNNFNKHQQILLISSAILRLVFLIIDRCIFELPGGSDDTVGFFNTITMISNDLNTINLHVYGGFYTIILGIISFITMPLRILLQSYNIYLMLFTIHFVLDLYNKYGKKSLCSNIIIYIIMYLPNAIILSVVLLREAFLIYFFTASFYYFILYLNELKIKYVVLSIFMLVLGSSFHGGIILMIIPYLIIYSLYDKSLKKLILSKEKIKKILILFFIGFLIFLNFGHIFAEKMTNVSLEKIYRMMNYNSGNSAYLTNIHVDSILDIIIYFIPKSIYFICSPTPMYWRDIIDIGVFFIDSIIYIFIITKLCTYLKKSSNIIKIFIISIFITMSIFAIGTWTAGSAVRHRHKFLYISSIICILAESTKKSKIKELEGI